MNDLRIEKNIAECNKHLKRINSAFVKMSAFMPIDSDKYLQLTDDDVEHIDQFLFRFSKLQDAMGEKLFVLLLEFMQEESVKSRPFIDILNRLEQLGLLDDKNIWLELRKIRNNISHQYDDEPQQVADALNAIYAAKPVMENIYTAIIASYISMKQRLQA